MALGEQEPIEQAILAEEVNAMMQALEILKTEKPDIFRLIQQRVVEGQSWREIQLHYAREHPGKLISEATLRQRFSRGRRYLRSIFHRGAEESSHSPAHSLSALPDD